MPRTPAPAILLLTATFAIPAAAQDAVTDAPPPPAEPPADTSTEFIHQDDHPTAQALEGAWVFDGPMLGMLMGMEIPDSPDEFALVFDFDADAASAFDADAIDLMHKEGYAPIASAFGFAIEGDRDPEPATAMLAVHTYDAQLTLLLLTDRSDHNQDWQAFGIVHVPGAEPAHDRAVLIDAGRPNAALRRADDDQSAALIAKTGAELDE